MWLTSPNGLVPDPKAPGFERGLLTTSRLLLNQLPTASRVSWEMGGGVVFFALHHCRGGRCRCFPGCGSLLKPPGNVGGPVEHHVALLGAFPCATEPRALSS